MAASPQAQFPGDAQGDGVSVGGYWDRVDREWIQSTPAVG